MESSETTILCARPGTRLWVVNLDGNVLQTSQFKMALSCPPTSIYDKYSQLCIEPPTSSSSLTTMSATHNKPNERLPQNLQLAKLQPLFGRYIFAYTKDGFYIFDPCKSSVLLWNDDIRDIQDIKLVNKNSLVIFTTNGNVFTLKIETLEELFSHMLDKKLYANCIQLLLNYREYYRQKFTDTPLYVICLHKLRSALCALEDENNDCDDGLREKLETNFGDFLSLNDDVQDEEQKQQPATQTNVIILGAGNNDDNNVTITSHLKDKFSTKYLLDDNLKSIIISTFSEKFSKNIFNKFNFFNDSDTVDVQQPQQQQSNNSQEISSVNKLPFSIRQSLVDINVNENCSVDDQIIDNPIRSVFDLLSTNEPSSQPIDALLSSVNEKNSEDRLLQNLFMIYKSAQMSNMKLVDRYSQIFDQYDCAGISKLLEKLEFLCIENGENEYQAKRHCLEMYFNYLNPDIIWEFDDESRKFIINGFITVNTINDNNNVNVIATSEICTGCAFPILLMHNNNKNKTEQSLKYPELARTLFKYLWSRNQQRQCMDIVIAVPKTLQIICQYEIQDESKNVEKLILLLYACDDRQLFVDALQKHTKNQLFWMKTFDVLISLQNAHRMICWNCGANNTIKYHLKLFDEQLIETISLRSWSYILRLMIQYLDGNTALQLIMNYSNFINCDVIDKDFYLRCLLKP